MANQNDKTRKAFRQGELLFIPLGGEDLAKLYPDLKDPSHRLWKKLGSNVLREGEATGHKHEVMEQTTGTAVILAPERQLMPGLPNMDLIGNEDRLLVAEEPVEIVHPEHRPLSLPRGNFLVVIQREYDEIKARRIMD
jgi:hypothetical protein